MMGEHLHIPRKTDLSNTQCIMNYTTVPAGLCIRGEMWTGQATTFTDLCPKCGRIGVASVVQNDKRIMVHRGRVTGNTLEGIDYCELLISVATPPSHDRHLGVYGPLREHAPNKEGEKFLTTALARLSQSLTIRLKWILHVLL